MGKTVAKPGSIAAALADLRSGELSHAERSAAFPIPLKVHRQRDAANEAGRRMARAFIKAENADAWIAAFPSTVGETLRAYLAGDFVFGSALPGIAAALGPVSRLDLSTLSLSMDNVETLAGLLASGIPINLAISHYFQGTNKTIFAALTHRLTTFRGFRLAVGRIHAKTCLFELPAAPPLIIETSANLRSSNTYEFATVSRCPDTFAFHRAFLDEFHRIAKIGQFTDFAAHAGPESYTVA